jgi:hypothetical protein
MSNHRKDRTKDTDVIMFYFHVNAVALFCMSLDVRLSISEWEKLEAIARSNKRSKSQVIRDWING